MQLRSQTWQNVEDHMQREGTQNCFMFKQQKQADSVKTCMSPLNISEVLCLIRTFLF